MVGDYWAALHVKFGFHVTGLWKTSCSRSSGDEVRQVSRASLSIDGNTIHIVRLILVSLIVMELMIALSYCFIAMHSLAQVAASSERALPVPMPLPSYSSSKV
jgi:hypothetical protein